MEKTSPERMKKEWVGLSLLWGIFPTQEVERWIPALQADFYQLSYQGSPLYSSVQSVQLLSHVLQGFPVHHQPPELTQTHVHWVGKAIQPSHPLSTPSPIFNLSQHQGLFKWVSSSHQVAKLLEPQLHISPSNEYLGLIYFRIDWLDFLAVQRTLKSLLQHHRSKVSALWGSAFFMIQLSHPYMTTGKTIALTRWMFVGEVISRLFNMLRY